MHYLEPIGERLSQVLNQMTISPSSIPLSDSPRCAVDVCDGSGVILTEQDGYSFGRICDCMKIKSRKKYLGEKFYNLNLGAIKPRNPKQEALQKLLRDNPRCGLFLTGQIRAGKTHFFAALYNYWDDASNRVKYLNDGMLRDELRQAELSSDTWYFQNLAKDFDHIFIDDLGKAAMTEFHRSAMFRFFDELYKNDKHLVVTSNFTLKQLAAEEYLGSPIVRRIEDLCEIVNL